MKLRVAYSPCPNDSIVFSLWEKKKDPFFDFDIRLGDIQTLNEWALSRSFDVIKVSAAILGDLLDDYVVLNCGAALGYGCGPKVVTCKKNIDWSCVRVALPGKTTTAAALFQMAYPNVSNLHYITYDDIMPKVANGDYDVGVIIHESRFLFSNYGLYEEVDLGFFWESVTNLPIPLGVVVARRSLGKELLDQLSRALQKSILYGRDHKQELMPWIKSRSIEKDETVIHQHIDLYVNDETVILSEKGKKALSKMIEFTKTRSLLGGAL